MQLITVKSMSTIVQTAPAARRNEVGPTVWATLGMMPFVVFAALFLVIPTALLLVGAFLDRSGNFTLVNMNELFANPAIVSSFWLSIKISFASALGGAFIGFFVAYAVILGGLPNWMRGAVMTFSGVASNFAGVPLAFAFLATLGRVGLVTMLLRDWLGFNLYSTGFNILSFFGLTLVYLYFQIPLMVLVIAPALDGLKKEWREANAVLGGSDFDYWRRIALPILFPSILGATLLLFANSFGAVATAYALTGSSLPIIPIQLMAQIRGDVLNNPNLGYAIAFGMVIITSLSSGAYIWLRSYSERWVR